MSCQLFIHLGWLFPTPPPFPLYLLIHRFFWTLGQWSFMNEKSVQKLTIFWYTWESQWMLHMKLNIWFIFFFSDSIPPFYLYWEVYLVWFLAFNGFCRCEPFSSYPRTYDFIHVASIESLTKDPASGKSR